MAALLRAEVFVLSSFEDLFKSSEKSPTFTHTVVFWFGEAENRCAVVRFDVEGHVLAITFRRRLCVAGQAVEC